MSGNSSCLLDTLDCTEEGRRSYLAAHGKPRAIFLSVLEPLSAPAIRCPAEGSPGADILLVFHGADCALWRPDNYLGCYWNATVQAFQGPGCQRAPTLDCACSHLTGARKLLARVTAHRQDATLCWLELAACLPPSLLSTFPLKPPVQTSRAGRAPSASAR